MYNKTAEMIPIYPLPIATKNNLTHLRCSLTYSKPSRTYDIFISPCTKTDTGFKTTLDYNPNSYIRQSTKTNRYNEKEFTRISNQLLDTAKNHPQLTSLLSYHGYTTTNPQEKQTPPPNPYLAIINRINNQAA